MSRRLFAATLFTGLSVLLWAETTQSKGFTTMQKKWWAFQPLKSGPAPDAGQGWAVTPIDRFVAAKHAEKHLRPNPRADKPTLLRRASLLVTGLNPTPAEMQTFLADNSPNAWEKVVDRLLASPHYGERWARHWLDLARYADSEGFKSDETRPNIWRYRDYVIKSFNEDKPYDRFVKEQIAGDELYPGNFDALVATGFNRHFPDESNAANIMQRRHELLFDITDTTASVFLGLTYGCAKCHDHKFDPILQKDYYRLQAFFANVRIHDEAELMASQDRNAWQKQYDAWDAQTKDIRAEMAALLDVPRKARFDDRLSRFPAEIQETITMDPAKRSPLQWHMYMKAKPQVIFSDDEMAKALKGDAAKRYKQLQAELKKFDSLKPAEMPTAQTLADMHTEPPKTHMLKAGNWESPGEEIAPGFLSILDPSDAEIAPCNGSSGRRAALASWLASPQNPLSPRVIVNRIWSYHFGAGIAGTPSDFGLMGERPTNLPLLDYLASDFIANGWSIKRLQKQILLSAVWQQSSAGENATASNDPENKYLWKFPRRRLEGEIIRDTMLQAAGMLNTKMYGPGVFPPLPPGVVTRGGWKSKEDPSEANRRSVYVFVRRNTRYPMFESFDMPDTHESCARRNLTVNPAQSLELMNSALVNDWSRGLARRVADDAGQNADGMLDRAWKLALQRTPTAAERDAAKRFLESQTQTTGNAETAWADLCHSLLATNEFLYLN